MAFAHRIGAVVGLLGIAGCDDVPGSEHSGDTDSACDFGCDESGLDTDPPVTTSEGATQVGSEGFWGCPVEHVEPITDPTEFFPDLGGSPSQVVASYLGEWPLLIEDLAAPGTTVTGSLGLSAGESWRWVDVTDGPTCVDHLAVSVGASLTREVAAPLALLGVVAVRPDGVGALVTTTALDQVGPEWSLPSSGAPFFRVEGPLGKSTVEAVATFADCPASEPTCDGQVGVSTLTGSR